jgi:hypothetical protein
VGINTRSLGGEGTRDTQAKTSQTSTSEISLDRPNLAPAESNKRDLAPSLISTSSYLRRKTTLSSTTCWLSVTMSMTAR